MFGHVAGSPWKCCRCRRSAPAPPWGLPPGGRRALFRVSEMSDNSGLGCPMCQDVTPLGLECITGRHIAALFMASQISQCLPRQTTRPLQVITSPRERVCAFPCIERARPGATSHSLAICPARAHVASFFLSGHFFGYGFGLNRFLGHLRASQVCKVICFTRRATPGREWQKQSEPVPTLPAGGRLRGATYPPRRRSAGRSAPQRRFLELQAHVVPRPGKSNPLGNGTIPPRGFTCWKPCYRRGKWVVLRCARLGCLVASRSGPPRASCAA